MATDAAFAHYPVSRFPGRCSWLTALSAFLTVLCGPAAGQEVLTFYRTQQRVPSDSVPEQVTSVTIVVQGAHGSYPDCGNLGGYGGLVQATFTVTPFEPLNVWPGWEAGFGYGSGGEKGDANHPGAGDGGFWRRRERVEADTLREAAARTEIIHKHRRGAVEAAGAPMSTPAWRRTFALERTSCRAMGWW